MGRMEKLRFELWALWPVLWHSLAGKGARLRRRHRRGEDVREDMARAVCGWRAELLAALRCRVDVQGAEHVPSDEGYVVMCNHQSMWDILLLVCLFGKPLGFVAKRELFRIPGVSFWMRQIGCFALDREDVRSGGAALAELGRRLKADRRGFIIFPEGTRSRDPDGAIQPFKRGSLRLAAENGLPVLPVAIDGTRHLDRPQAWARTRGGGRVVRVWIGRPRPTAELSAPARKEFMERLRDTLISHREAIRVEWPAN